MTKTTETITASKIDCCKETDTMNNEEQDLRDELDTAVDKTERALKAAVAAYREILDNAKGPRFSAFRGRIESYALGHLEALANSDEHGSIWDIRDSLEEIFEPDED